MLRLLLMLPDVEIPLKSQEIMKIRIRCAVQIKYMRIKIAILKGKVRGIIDLPVMAVAIATVTATPTHHRAYDDHHTSKHRSNDE